MLPYKDVGELVQFYYHWKKTPAGVNVKPPRTADIIKAAYTLQLHSPGQTSSLPANPPAPTSAATVNSSTAVESAGNRGDTQRTASADEVEQSRRASNEVDGENGGQQNANGKRKGGKREAASTTTRRKTRSQRDRADRLPSGSDANSASPLCSNSTCISQPHMDTDDTNSAQSFATLNAFALEPTKAAGHTDCASTGPAQEAASPLRLPVAVGRVSLDAAHACMLEESHATAAHPPDPPCDFLRASLEDPSKTHLIPFCRNCLTCGMLHIFPSGDFIDSACSSLLHYM